MVVGHWLVGVTLVQGGGAKQCRRAYELKATGSEAKQGRWVPTETILRTKPHWSFTAPLIVVGRWLVGQCSVVRGCGAQRCGRVYGLKATGGQAKQGHRLLNESMQCCTDQTVLVVRYNFHPTRPVT